MHTAASQVENYFFISLWICRNIFARKKILSHPDRSENIHIKYYITFTREQQIKQKSIGIYRHDIKNSFIWMGEWKRRTD